MEQFIEVNDWDRFQHYKRRDPIWIKNYTRLLHDDAYLGLTAQQRGVLHSLWILYAASNRNIPVNTAKLSRKLGVRVTKRTLDALSNAGFIHFRASTVLDQRQSRDIKSFSEVNHPRQVLQLLKTGSEGGA